MISYTSANVNKWGLVSSDGPRVRHVEQRQLPKGCGCLVGLFALLLIVLVILGVTARPYHGENAGLAWDWGGIETNGNPGLFLCSGNYDPATGIFTPSPWAEIFPSLVTDC